MEQHPIPQQITSYEFKLVGEMTLKQFGKAAGGIILALLVNASPLVFFIKWPLMFFFAVGGLALAFVPFQDRPLDTWVKSFIRAIYSPTVYTYKKRTSKNWLDIDLSKNLAQIKEEEEEEREEETKPIKQGEKVREFIESLPSIDKEEKQELKEEKKEMAEKVVGDEKPEVKKDQGVNAKQNGTKTEEDWTGGRPELQLKREKQGATGEIVFGEIPMPDIPELPNLVVGMVMDKNKKIVEGAIVEIQDREGNPNRVLKTNSLGQFKTSTQLANGDYLIVTEKENLSFDRVNLQLLGKIVSPIRIIAK